MSAVEKKVLENKKTLYRAIAFDLDGTLTQHKSPLSAAHARVLSRLSERYHLLMVGAGSCERIWKQMNEFPIEIIGNYGMQHARCVDGVLRLTEQFAAPMPDRASCDARMNQLRERYGLTRYAGDTVEYHRSGMITLPLLGTAAALPDKLAFDPDKRKRRGMFEDVKALFPEFTAFIGGTSSFDMVPRPYGKYWALDRWCALAGLDHAQVLFVGDDYTPGGNDEPVCASDFDFLIIDDYTHFPERIAPLAG